MKKIKIHILLGMFVIIIDQITKVITTLHLKESQTISVIPNFFHFTFVKNTGAAWGIFEKNTILLAIFSIVIIGVFCVTYLRNKDNVIRLCLALIIAGAIGNLIDRIRLQYVVDFLDFNILGYNFPVFNIADIAVSIPTILLVVYLFLGEKNASR